MISMHGELEGKANLYTMDHRGTGRSTLLDCVSTQATTSGSPLGGDIDLSEVDACAQDLQYKFGDLSSFSITSAATDIATFISESTNGKSTIVCGFSYGTALVERLMHLKAPTVVGYVLDSVSTTSAAANDNFPFVSMNDRDLGEVADAFLDLCVRDEGCSRYFKSTSLPDLLQQLIEKFDKEPNSTCAQLVSAQGASDPPSISLRATLGSALLDSTMRAFIPPLVYRLNHCAEGDVTVLKPFFASPEPQDETEPQDSAYTSVLLYNLINFSEFYEKPAPPFAVLKERQADATISGGVGLDKTNRFYCAFSKEKSPTCDELQLGKNSSTAIIYKPDQYWNATSVIPSHASVLLLSGKLDAETPPKYAKALFEGLVGSNKELIAFEHATHCTIGSTPYSKGGKYMGTCGMKLLASYVKNGGNLDSLDKSCVDEMPALNLTIPADYLREYLGTDDAYDGNTTRAGSTLST